MLPIAETFSECVCVLCWLRLASPSSSKWRVAHRKSLFVGLCVRCVRSPKCTATYVTRLYFRITHLPDTHTQIHSFPPGCACVPSANPGGMMPTDPKTRCEQALRFCQNQTNSTLASWIRVLCVPCVWYVWVSDDVHTTGLMMAQTHTHTRRVRGKLMSQIMMQPHRYASVPGLAGGTQKVHGIETTFLGQRWGVDGGDLVFGLADHVLRLEICTAQGLCFRIYSSFAHVVYIMDEMKNALDSVYV